MNSDLPSSSSFSSSSASPPQLTVPPSTPLDFKVHTTDPSWVNLSWSRVIETGDYPLLGYEVSLKSFLKKWPDVQQIVHNYTPSVNISGLIPSVEYSATVKALSIVSTLTSLPSVLQNFTTQKSGTRMTTRNKSLLLFVWV